MQGVSGAMEEARRETQGIYEEAVLAIQGSDAVREALGAPIEVTREMRAQVPCAGAVRCAWLGLGA